MDDIRQQMDACEQEIKRLNELKAVEIEKLTVLRNQLWEMDKEEE